MNKSTLTSQEEHDLLRQARETVDSVINARNQAEAALEELRPRLIDAIDNFLSDTGKVIKLNPTLGVELWEPELGEEPTDNIGAAEIGAVSFSQETGQSILAEEGAVDESGQPCYGYTTYNLNSYDLTELLARLLNEE